MIESTWEVRDRPVLEAVVLIADAEDGMAWAGSIARQAGLDREATQRALRALAGETPPFFDVGQENAGGNIMFVQGVTGAARRAVGAWPSPDVMADRLIDVLQRVVDDPNAPEEKRSRARDLLKSAGGVGRDVFVAALGQVAGMGAAGVLG